jgi:hypothetical protein
MSKNDSLDLLHNALDMTLQRATAHVGPEVANYVPVFRKAIEILVKLIRERGHRDTMNLLDMLAAMPPESL